jgi:hypothetical protein
MRILSKFQDYYDSGLVYGVDTKLLYERKTENILYSELSNSHRNLLNEYINNLPNHSGWNNDFSLTPGVIGFCGKLYPIYQYIDNTINYRTYDYFTNFNKFAKSCKNLPESMFKVRDKKTVDYKSRRFTTKPELWCFELAEQTYAGTLAEDIFYSLNVPVFLRWSNQKSWVNKELQTTITVNPSLKELGFQHYFDPLVAFQEVSMYVGSLQNRNENVNYTVGSDKVIAESKGHSIKESFRQSAPTKKQKRKLNKESKQ